MLKQCMSFCPAEEEKKRTKEISALCESCVEEEEEEEEEKMRNTITVVLLKIR